MSENTCQHCQYWADRRNPKKGVADCGRIEICPDTNQENSAYIGASASDDQGLDALLMTGKDFSCSLFKANKTDRQKLEVWLSAFFVERVPEKHYFNPDPVPFGLVIKDQGDWNELINELGYETEYRLPKALSAIPDHQTIGELVEWAAQHFTKA